MVIIFVNDIKIIGAKNFRVISQVKEKLTATFKMIDIDAISIYFSLKISQNHEKR